MMLGLGGPRRRGCLDRLGRRFRPVPEPNPFRLAAVAPHQAGPPQGQPVRPRRSFLRREGEKRDTSESRRGDSERHRPPLLESARAQLHAARRRAPPQQELDVEPPFRTRVLRAGRLSIPRQPCRGTEPYEEGNLDLVGKEQAPRRRAHRNDLVSFPLPQDLEPVPGHREPAPLPVRESRLVDRVAVLELENVVPELRGTGRERDLIRLKPFAQGHRRCRDVVQGRRDRLRRVTGGHDRPASNLEAQGTRLEMRQVQAGGERIGPHEGRLSLPDLVARPTVHQVGARPGVAEVDLRGLRAQRRRPRLVGKVEVRPLPSRLVRPTTPDEERRQHQRAHPQGRGRHGGAGPTPPLARGAVLREPAGHVPGALPLRLSSASPRLAGAACSMAEGGFSRRKARATTRLTASGDRFARTVSRPRAPTARAEERSAYTFLIRASACSTLGSAQTLPRWNGPSATATSTSSKSTRNELSGVMNWRFPE